MIRFSARFGAAIAVLGLLALAPVAYVGSARERDECQPPGALLDARAIDARTILVTEGDRATNFSKARLTGRIPRVEDGPAETIYTIMRSSRLLPVHSQPADALPGSREPDVVTSAELEVDGARLPMRYAVERKRQLIRITAYLVAYRSGAIERPFWALLRDAPGRLVSGRWPITLFVASTQSRIERRAAAEERVEALLRSAWRHYEATCGTRAGASPQSRESFGG